MKKKGLSNIIKVQDPNSKELQEYLTKFKYQESLTEELDKLIDKDFDIMILLKIILWKTNRYPDVENFPFAEVNKLKKIKTVEYPLCKHVLLELLNLQGFGLPMASTVLRFRNPDVFPIIDRRAYRAIMESGLRIYHTTKHEKQVEIYFEYIEKCREISEGYGIPFRMIDRVLYLFDKEQNKELKL